MLETTKYGNDIFIVHSFVILNISCKYVESLRFRTERITGDINNFMNGILECF